jgi:ribose/xylose/arabinose/galactoside ABC-type transport system permease subunit
MALGSVNGALVAGARIPAIIVTLGTMGIIRGAMTWATRGVWIRGLPDWFRDLGEAAPLGAPLALWVMAAVGLSVTVLMARTRPGRRFYAVGSSAHAARLAGIRVARVLLLAFVFVGALTGLAALVYATRFTVIQSNAGKGFELQVIAAVVVGGTDIFGGRGTVPGTYLGVLLLATIGTALTFLHLPAEWEPAIQGGLILAAVMGRGSRR